MRADFRPSVSTVTCAFSETRWNDTVAALDSIRHQTRQPDEIWLVIDHNPSLLERARAALSDVHVVPNTHRLGVSGARNTGGELATGEIVAFLDDDAQASSTWLERLIDPFQDPLVAGVGGEARPLWTDVRPSWFPREFDWVVGCSYVGLPTTRSPVRNLIGTNMSVRRDLLASVNGFREGFGNVVLRRDENSATGRLTTGEETDFCIRLAASRPEMIWVYEPSAVVYHRVTAERATFHYFLWRCWTEGKGKATLSVLLGSSSALATERDYAWKVLPQAVWRDLRGGWQERSFSGLARSGAILAGFGITGLSYLWHRGVPLPRPGVNAIDDDSGGRK